MFIDARRCVWCTRVCIRSRDYTTPLPHFPTSVQAYGARRCISYCLKEAGQRRLGCVVIMHHVTLHESAASHFSQQVAFQFLSS